jgi:hypothetical protein
VVFPSEIRPILGNQVLIWGPQALIRPECRVTSSDGGQCEFLKSSFFVVAVFTWSKRVVFRINMQQEATRTPHMAPWGWVKVENNIFIFPNILRKNISV